LIDTPASRLTSCIVADIQASPPSSWV
jgi:hypothetical protein